MKGNNIKTCYDMKPIIHARWLVLLCTFAMVSPRAFNWGNSSTQYWGGPPNPPTGFLAQIDIFYGTVGSTTGNWGWTLARYWGGTALNLNRTLDGRDNDFNLIVLLDQNLSHATYALAENYWFDSDWYCGKSTVATTSGNLKKAYAEVHD